MKKNKNVFLIIFTILLITIFLGLFTYGLAFIVSNPHYVFGDFKIDNFETSNDWIGFGGYILTAIISILTLFVTILQTRKIQEQNTQIQEWDRRNAIKPRLDIDVPIGAFIKYNIDESKQKAIIRDVRIDSTTKFSQDSDNEVCKSLIKILNLSPNSMAKSLNIKISTNLDNIKKSLADMNMKVEEKQKPCCLQINNKQNSICILTKDVIDSRKIEDEYNFRFLRGNDEIILDLNIYLHTLKDLLEVLLYGYIKNTYKNKIMEFTINNRTIIEFLLDIQCEDIEFYKYKSSYIIKVIAESVDWKNNEVLILFKIEDIKRDNYIKK